MSIPAVLYDHVPVDDLQCDSDLQHEIDGATFYISSMIHRTSAPREDGGGGVSSKNRRPAEQPKPIGSEGVCGESRDYDSDDLNEIEVFENDENSILPMETIFDEKDSDYVLIPIPPPTNGDDNKILPISSHKTARMLFKKIRSCGEVILRAVKRSSKSSSGRITNVSKANDAIVTCLSGCASVSRSLLKPFQFYVRTLLSSSIYSSYDWVSETVIDNSGNRLILPGSCIALDSDVSRARSTDRDNEYSADDLGTGTLIVPAASNSSGLEPGIAASSYVPVKSPSSSSSSVLWASKTIMVSAHDLLAIKHDQRMQLGDRPLSLSDVREDDWIEKSHHDHYYYIDDEYIMDQSTIMVASTQTIKKRWSRAVWKLTQRKINVWYSISDNYIRLTIQNAGRFFQYSRQLLVQYCKVNNGFSYCRFQRNANGGLASRIYQTSDMNYDESRDAEKQTNRSMLIISPQQRRCDRSIGDKQSSDASASNFDRIPSGDSEHLCVIEMASSVLKG